ncbi:MAG TPA: YegS/Rv2252/BmrU family lipid kinase [Chitinophagaceae bacterium]|nr:YegS/Rv2252/BmrU family lipid kinase [Chitinophagaceae bacterium]
MQRRIIYIINPIAGTGSKTNLQKIIEEKTKQKEIPFQIFPSVASGDYSFLRSIIKEKNITDIIIAGGDGTVSQVIECLMNEGVSFGIIPCGSGNGLALAAKISKQPAKALDIIFSGKPLFTDGFFVNNHFACMLAGLGFDAKVAKDFTDEPRRGLLTYIKLSLKNFFSMKPHRFEIEIQEVKFETDAYFISIANSNQFGNNFTIAPKASLSDGLLDVVIVTAQNKVSFILQTLTQLAGWNKPQASSIIQQKKGVIYFQTEKLKIINHSGAPLHIDGEPAETPAALKIEIKKKCFRLIQPA